MKSWIAIALSAIALASASALALASASALALASASAFTVQEAVIAMVPERAGAHALRSFMEVLKNFHGNRQSSQHTEACLQHMAESLDDFKLRKIYDSSFLVSGDKGYRGLTFQGQNGPGAYALDIAPAHRARPALLDTGSMTADIALKRNRRSVAGDPSFSTYCNAALNTGRLSHESVLNLWEGLLKVFSPENIRRLAAQECQQDRAMCRLPYDAMRDVSKAFPALHEFLGKRLAVTAKSTLVTQDGEAFNRLTVRGVLLLDALHEDFPWMASHFTHLQGAFRIRMELTNQDEHAFMELDINSNDHSFTMTLCTRDGKVIPYDGLGKPIFQEEFSLNELRELLFDVNLSLYSNANGLTFATEGIRILADYERTGEGMLLFLRSDNLVDTQVSGRALYVFPAWSVDLLLPTSMEELIYDFSTVMIQANGGEGTVLKIACDTRDKDNTKTHVYASTEILDNFFVQFGAKMAGDYFGMGPITKKESRRFLSQLIDAVLADLKALQGVS